MTLTACNAAELSNAVLVVRLDEYLASVGKSARWLGWTVARDVRLMPNLRRGQQYPVSVIRALWERLATFYAAELEREERAALGQFFEQQLAA